MGNAPGLYAQSVSALALAPDQDVAPWTYSYDHKD